MISKVSLLSLALMLRRAPMDQCLQTKHASSSQSDNGGEQVTKDSTYDASTPEDDSTFLRGWELTDENGVVKVETIYPGWYSGRALHIHLKVFIPATIYDNGTYATTSDNIHTGQLFFNDTLTTDIGNYYPYSLNTVALTLNSQDNLYLEEGGEYALLNLVQLGSDYSAGFLGSVTVGVEANDTSLSDSSSPTNSSSTNTKSGSTSAKTWTQPTATAGTTTVGASTTGWGYNTRASLGSLAAVFVLTTLGAFFA